MSKASYAGLLDIPEGVSGAWEIKHKLVPAGTPLSRTTMRTMLLGGHRAAALVYDRETRWHQLLEAGKLWMTDLPIEQWQARRQLARLYGHVLVGGCGLGMILQLLRREKSVREITVIEYSSDVLRLVTPHHTFATTRVTFVWADLAQYLAECDLRFDTAFFDTWTTDSEGEFFDTVLPLRMAAKRCVTGSVVAWNEDVMRSQLSLGINSRLHFIEGDGDDKLRLVRDGDPIAEALTECTGSKYHDWAVPFFQWVQANHAKLSLADRQIAAARYVQMLDAPKGPTSATWQRGLAL